MVILWKPQRSKGLNPLELGEKYIVCYLQDLQVSKLVGFVKYAMEKEIRNTRLNMN